LQGLQKSLALKGIPSKDVVQKCMKGAHAASKDEHLLKTLPYTLNDLQLYKKA